MRGSLSPKREKNISKLGKKRNKEKHPAKKDKKIKSQKGKKT